MRSIWFDPNGMNGNIMDEEHTSSVGSSSSRKKKPIIIINQLTNVDKWKKVLWKPETKCLRIDRCDLMNFVKFPLKLANGHWINKKKIHTHNKWREIEWVRERERAREVKIESVCTRENDGTNDWIAKGKRNQFGKFKREKNEHDKSCMKNY